MNHERSLSSAARGQLPPSPRPGVALLASTAEDGPSFASPQKSTVTMLLAPQPDQKILPAAVSMAVSQQRTRRSFRLTHRWLLASILLLQAALSVRLLWANTAFDDEGLYLWAGHLEWSHWLHGTSSATLTGFPTWFSGAPVVYPPLGAIADILGGLAGARLLSLVFMLGASLCLYGTTKRLLDGSAALFAALAWVVLAPTQILSAFATYDPMAIFLLAFGTWLGVRAGDRRTYARVFLLATSGVMLALACAAKYATALWVPAAVAVVAIATWQLTRVGVGVLTGLGLAVWWGGVVAAALEVAGPDYWHGILFTTLARNSNSVPAVVVLDKAFGWIWPVLIFGILALLSSVASSWSVRFLCCCTVGAALLAPLNQARLHTSTSLQKHVDFGAWFAAIAVGYLLSRLCQIDARAAWRAVLAGCIALVLAGSLHTANGIASTWWPNYSGAIKALRFVRPSSRPLLMAFSNTGYYYLHDQVYPGQINKYGGYLWWNATTHTELTGLPAVSAALAAHHFSGVELSEQAVSPKEYQAILRQLTNPHSGYNLIYKRPWTYFGKRSYQWVWKLVKA